MLFCFNLFGQRTTTLCMYKADFVCNLIICAHLLTWAWLICRKNFNFKTDQLFFFISGELKCMISPPPKRGGEGVRICGAYNLKLPLLLTAFLICTMLYLMWTPKAHMPLYCRSNLHDTKSTKRCKDRTFYGKIIRLSIKGSIRGGGGRRTRLYLCVNIQEIKTI